MEPGLSRLRQIALSCRNLEDAVAFYRHVLKLELIAQFPPALAFFRLGDLRLMLERSPATERAGVLYFEVTDIHAAQAALEARGVQFEGKPHVIYRDADGTFGTPGGEEWMTFFKDPDENQLALAERVAASG